MSLIDFDEVVDQRNFFFSSSFIYSRLNQREGANMKHLLKVETGNNSFMFSMFYETGVTITHKSCTKEDIRPEPAPDPLSDISGRLGPRSH